MNFSAPILDMIGAACKAANAILSFVPALAWALLLAVATAYGGLMHHERDSAVKAKNEAIGEKQQIVAQLAQQKKDAKAKLDALTAERDALQVQVNEAHQAQEKKDAENDKIIADQNRRLRALAAASPGGRLRDPNAGRGCGRAGAEGNAAATPRSSEEHPAEVGGLLSKELSGLLLRLTGEADDINAAYESARADAMMCRAATGSSP
jgi:hypothetical protein